MLNAAAYSAKRSSGFTLVEVLVAVVILSVGLLGLAGMQTRGLRANHSAWLRSEATILAYDMLDRMRANRENARAGNYNLALGDASPTGTSIWEQDLRTWLGEIARRLPVGDGAVTVVSDVVTVTVQWDDSRGSTSAQQFVMESRI